MKSSHRFPSGWVYAFSGVLAAGIASVAQFAFGMLVLAVPLAVIGLGFILRGILFHARRTNAASADAEHESGEPLAEEIVETASAPPPVAKISAKDGGFAKSVTAKSKGDGHIDLSSTKYLNRSPGTFRKGKTEATNDE